MDNTDKIITKDAQETSKLGEDLARVGDGRIFCLYGDLGSGKTTFTQGFARGLGVTVRLLSPTFIIVRRYDLPKHNFFYHVDLYRLTSIAQMDGLGISEIFADPRAFIVVEWAEKLGKLLPVHRTDISFETMEDGRHTVWIKKQ